MGKFVDLTGRRFGRLVVIKQAGRNSFGKITWLCKCDCGNTTKPIVSQSLKSGASQSCGCLKNEMQSRLHATHGMSDTRLCKIWYGIRKRCFNKNCSTYHHYGGRGVTMCHEWVNSFESFRDWALANGYTDELTIDRIDVNGNYCPENCRWADTKTQHRNMRTNRYITFNGETKTLTEWGIETGFGRSVIKARLERGWSIERALTEKA